MNIYFHFRKFMTHGNGASCPESLEMYEQQLKKLRPIVKFTRDRAFVPSFMEDWIFYQVSHANQWCWEVSNRIVKAPEASLIATSL